MKYYSTQNRQRLAGLREAVMQGLAPDSGLYMPQIVPRLDESFYSRLHKTSLQEIALHVAKAFIGPDIPENELERIIGTAINFDAPLVRIEENIFALELFHGPTLAFKDFGARFLAGLVGYFSQQSGRAVTILVATSGDTGSAVANGFLNVAGVRVMVLYPSGKVSEAQEKQFTTLGGNITALEVQGTFDDCQRLVKEAFLDHELNSKFFLTSANSINIGRLIPQTFYYFHAIAQLGKQEDPVVVSVPSGNFGNLAAGLLARKMGLPIAKFVAATNINDVVPAYLASSRFSPRPSVQTISNAMDVGHPSNFARLMDLFNHDWQQCRDEIKGYRFTDEQTRAAMRHVFASHGYVMDPHGAIGYLGLKEYKKVKSGFCGIFLETAHPGKFKEVVEEAINSPIVLPDALQKFMHGKKSALPVSALFADFKEYLLRTL